MRRPTERPTPGVRELADEEAPPFIEAHRVTLLAFVDLAAEHSLRLRGRLNLVTARHVDAGKPRRLGVGVIDVTEHGKVAEALAVRSVPTIVVFVDGEVVDRLEGVVPETVLDEVVQTRLAR